MPQVNYAEDIAAGRVHSTDDARRAIAADLGVSV